MQDRPMLKKLIERLDLQVQESKEFKRNVEIEKRAQVLIDQLALTPKEPRRIIKARAWWDAPPDLSWMPPGYCPF